MTDSILFQIIFIASSVLLLGYVLLLFFYKKKWNAIPESACDVSHQDTFVSIVVAARNEEDNIEKLIH